MEVDLINLVAEVRDRDIVFEKKITFHSLPISLPCESLTFIETVQGNSRHNEGSCPKGGILFPRRDELVIHVEHFMLYKFTALISEEIATIVI